MPPVRLLVLPVLLAVLAGCAGGGEAPADEPASEQPRFQVLSPAFEDGGAIPREHSCDGPETSPPLRFEGAPARARAVALVAEDPDVPFPEAPARTLTHWVLWDLPAVEGAAELPAGSVPPEAKEGPNDGGGDGWLGPCPPPGSSPHGYRFLAYALDAPLGVPDGSTRAQVEAAMQGRVLASDALLGTYARQPLAG